MTNIVLIAAVAKNLVIGADGDMPWRVPSDLKHFKRLTMGKPMVMGRKTFQSLPGLLPGRPHLVVTRDASFVAEGGEVFSSLEAAVKRGEELVGHQHPAEVCIIGGGQIYAQAMEFASRLELTEIDEEPEGDTVFPTIDKTVWQEASRVRGERTDRDSAAFSFVTYVRREA